MRQRLYRSLIVCLCAFACAAAAGLSLGSLSANPRTQDRNGDGRPDAWSFYDHQGRLSDVTLDTNFDGRPDVHEYYTRGSLTRRESDRDFNNRVDLIQEFDPATHEHARSVVDVDFDGHADLLVLFRDGEPVFTKWLDAPDAQPAPRVVLASAADGSLAPLDDPFSADLAVREARATSAPDDVAGLSTSGGLPEPHFDAACPFTSPSNIANAGSSLISSADPALYSPRGPPAVHFSS